VITAARSKIQARRPAGRPGARSPWVLRA
jgi:hypothetical protein